MGYFNFLTSSFCIYEAALNSLFARAFASLRASTYIYTFHVNDPLALLQIRTCCAGGHQASME